MPNPCALSVRADQVAGNSPMAIKRPYSRVTGLPCDASCGRWVVNRSDRPESLLDRPMTAENGCKTAQILDKRGPVG